MPLSEIERRHAEKDLAEYCARKNDHDVRHLLEIVYRIEGNVAYLAERRPDWRDPSIRRDGDVAKFRFVVKLRTEGVPGTYGGAGLTRAVAPT